jgi:TolB-like protein
MQSLTATSIVPGVEVFEQQLEKISNDPLFSEAGILKKFLKYIVRETIYGRSNCLKEYTIATNVLGKPLDFKPQENGIVRIHAGRLRRALDTYYEGSGICDELIISIPKGKYVPDFAMRDELTPKKVLHPIVDETSAEPETDSAIAVVPLLFDEENPLTKLFMNGFCLQLSNSLMELKDSYVISYQTIKGMVDTDKDLRDLHHTVGCSYIVSGCVQVVHHHVRVTLQLFLAKSGQQVWSEIYERVMTKTNVLQIQDELIKKIIPSITESLSHIKGKGLLAKMEAV